MDENLEREIVQAIARNETEYAKRLMEKYDVTEEDKKKISNAVYNYMTAQKMEQHDIPMFPVISLILGFLLAIAGMFFEKPTQEMVVAAGLFLIFIPPGIGIMLEKFSHGRDCAARSLQAAKYGEVGADINFPFVMPSAPVVTFFVLGALLLVGAFCLINRVPSALLLLMAAVGFVCLVLSQLLLKRYCRAFCWGILFTVVMLMFTSVYYFMPETANTLSSVLLLIAALLSLCTPLLYYLFTLLLCTEEVEAEVVDLIERRSIRRYRTDYALVWKYTYDGVTYIHKEEPRRKYPECEGPKRVIRIAPHAPQNIYYKKFPPIIWSIFFLGTVCNLPLFLVSLL